MTEETIQTHHQSEEQEAGEARKKFMILTLRGNLYSVPLTDVKEVVTSYNITPVPKLPVHYKGVINLRGQIVTVIDLGKKLGFADVEFIEKMTCVVIFQVEDIVLGALVDEVVAVESYKTSAIQFSTKAAESTTKDKEISRVIRAENGSLIMLIDVEKALGLEQIRAMRDTLVS